MDNLTINIDGGSRGNPGAAAFGVVFFENGHIVKRYGQYLGEKTNNEAEYEALIFALKKAKALWGKERIKKIPIEIRSDSELLVRQLNGQYKIQEPKIQKLFLEAWNLKIDFGGVEIVAVPREKNKEADRLVNEALDAHVLNKPLF
ncbi:MAG: ribonuclease HI family protein [Candidatus Pacebacteria bacterium]|nr:ribonuclease HI family protein [Candidatus Paceibacterota bacterium]